MPDPKMTRLQADLEWLAERQRHNRQMFGGWRMEADPATPPPTDPPADPPANPPADPAKTPPWGDAANFNAEKAWELIQNLRSEKSPNADLQRELDELKQAGQAQLDAIAKAAGLKSEDKPADPAELAKQITDEQAKTTAVTGERDAARRQLAVYQVAADPEIAANASRLLDSSSFLASIADIDPTDTAKLTEKVKAAVEADEMFKASRAPATPPFPGGPRPSATPRAGSMDEAIANKMAAAQTR